MLHPMPAAAKAWMLAQNVLCPRQHAAPLLYHLATQDWRDVIPRITLPTLIIGGQGTSGSRRTSRGKATPTVSGAISPCWWHSCAWRVIRASGLLACANHASAEEGKTAEA